MQSFICQSVQIHIQYKSLLSLRAICHRWGFSVSVHGAEDLFLCLPVGGVWYLKIIAPLLWTQSSRVSANQPKHSCRLEQRWTGLRSNQHCQSVPMLLNIVSSFCKSNHYHIKCKETECIMPDSQQGHAMPTGTLTFHMEKIQRKKNDLPELKDDNDDINKYIHKCRFIFKTIWKYEQYIIIGGNKVKSVFLPADVKS